MLIIIIINSIPFPSFPYIQICCVYTLVSVHNHPDPRHLHRHYHTKSGLSHQIIQTCRSCQLCCVPGPFGQYSQGQGVFPPYPSPYLVCRYEQCQDVPVSLAERRPVSAPRIIICHRQWPHSHGYLDTADTGVTLLKHASAQTPAVSISTLSGAVVDR